ncbi:MAG: ATP-grasp fold amidoligase family protein [Bacilli bacterium]
MKLHKKLLKFVSDNKFRISILNEIGLFNDMSDEKFLKLMYKTYFNEELNLDNPKSYNEKIQWIKLHDRNPLYTTLVDKYNVRQYVAKMIGEKYLIPIYGVYSNVNEIDFSQLPEMFVLKCTHNSGKGMCICRNKSELNEKKCKKQLQLGLKENYYMHAREWPYKNVPRKIIAEKYLIDDSGEGLRDYKFYCFQGKVKLILIVLDRFSSSATKGIFFTENFERVDMQWGFENYDGDIKKPEKFDEMIEISEKLSKDLVNSRIDLYLAKNNEIYFGEITLFDGSGFEEIVPKKWDYQLGNWLALPTDKDEVN